MGPVQIYSSTKQSPEGRGEHRLGVGYAEPYTKVCVRLSYFLFPTKFWTIFCDFLFFKTHFRFGRDDNKEKHLFYFSLRIIFPINCKLWKLKIQKIPKSTTQVLWRC
jgi:hypothetical protein